MCIADYVYWHGSYTVCIYEWRVHYGVASVSRIDKIIVSFAEYRLFYRALLQKSPVIWSILLTKATPYVYYHVYSHKCNDLL